MFLGSDSLIHKLTFSLSFVLHVTRFWHCRKPTATLWVKAGVKLRDFTRQRLSGGPDMENTLKSIIRIRFSFFLQPTSLKTMSWTKALSYRSEGVTVVTRRTFEYQPVLKQRSEVHANPLRLKMFWVPCLRFSIRWFQKCTIILKVKFF